MGRGKDRGEELEVAGMEEEEADRGGERPCDGEGYEEGGTLKKGVKNY